MRDYFRPARRVGGGNGTKFSLRAKNGPKSAFWGVLGEFCTAHAVRRGMQGEFCTGWARRAGRPESFVPGVVETGVAFARSCSCGVETAVAFVGENRVLLVRFVVAEVSSVSAVAVHG